jgi:hypothetical protein
LPQVQVGNFGQRRIAASALGEAVRDVRDFAFEEVVDNNLSIRGEQKCYCLRDRDVAVDGSSFIG